MENRMIKVWQFRDAPGKYQELSNNGGDEDWLAWVPEGYPHDIPWLERGIFGVCEIAKYKILDGTVYIGCHA